MRLTVTIVSTSEKSRVHSEPLVRDVRSLAQLSKEEKRISRSREWHNSTGTSSAKVSQEITFINDK